MRVMVNGTFDILHRGHLQLLNFAKEQGEHLLVAIDTDKRVQLLKGPTRPVNSQEDRKFHLENLKAVDEVRFFDSEDTLVNIMKEYQPDVYVKGSDWRGTGKNTAHKYAKQVIYYDRIGEYSTTNIIQSITDR
jgi:rfaE bifunctional protein nucleotidyltransferase chain/domain